MSTSVESHLGSYFLAKNVPQNQADAYLLVKALWPWFDEVFLPNINAFAYIRTGRGWGQNQSGRLSEQYRYTTDMPYTLFQTRLSEYPWNDSHSAWVFKPCPYCGMSGTPQEKASLAWDDIKTVVLGVEVCEGPLPHCCGPCGDWYLEHDGEAPPWAAMKRE